jgi:hypothetical protein
MEGNSVNLQLQRTDFTDNSTIGALSIDGEFECFTLEDPVRKEKIKGITAIPAGTYQVAITFSPRFQKLLPLLLNVPNFEGVRIHVGNFPRDTKGCILVGETKETDMILESKVAFAALFEKLQVASDTEEIVIEITGERPGIDG